MKNILLNKIIRNHNNILVTKENKYKVSSVNEWYNSVYYYNKNYMNNIHIKDTFANYVINSYFNSIPMSLIKKRIKRNRINMKRIFISKSEIKHNTDNINITIYSFNKQKKIILNNLQKINKMFLKRIEYKNYIRKLKTNLKAWIFIVKYTYKGILSNLTNIKNIKINLFMYNLNKVILENNISYKVNIIKDVIRNKYRYIYLYQYYISMLYINNLKFNNNIMLGMINILNKLYKKKVIINIISLKYLFMDNSLLLDGIVRKLRDRKKRILRVIRRAVGLSKKCILSSWLLIPNIYKNLSNENLDLENNSVISYENYKIPALETYKYNLINYIYNKNNSFILTELKYKFIRGLHIKGSGRLTKRLTASRSISKNTNKGSLQNIYSSHQNISTLMLRNDIKCNQQYLNVNTKGRNGSFSIRSWINSY